MWQTQADTVFIEISAFIFIGWKSHLPALELAEDGVCRWGEEYADESKLRGADGDGGNMQE